MQTTTTTTTWFETVKLLTESLIRVPSVNADISAERACGQIIANFLIEGDLEEGLTMARWETENGRLNIASLLRGDHPNNTGETIILMGHYDTVGAEEFRALTPDGQLAFNPPSLRQAIEKRLDGTRTAKEEAIWQDLQAMWQGEPAWLFGRGSCDMKSGIAINIALIRHLLNHRKQLAGNILFLACADEEGESDGIRSAVPRLLELQKTHGLNYVGLINTDYIGPRRTDMTTRTVYTGTVGKLLPAFYVVGVPTHVGEPFRGVDASEIASALVQRINVNTDLCDRWVAEDGRELTAVPPITLQLRDLKQTYDTQTANEAFLYVNWLTYNSSPERVLNTLRHITKEAINSVTERRQANYLRFTGEAEPPSNEPAHVLTFSELCQQVQQSKNWSTIALGAQLDDLALEASMITDDLREQSRHVVAKMAQYAGLAGTAVIIFFAPPYYPHIQPQSNHVTQALDTLLQKGEFMGEQIELRGFYPYISDLSYVQLDATIRPSLPALIANMPLFGRGYELDFEAIQQLNCPVIDIGPYGKDAHGLFERVYMPYSFEVVPELIYQLIQSTLFGAK